MSKMSRLKTNLSVVFVLVVRDSFGLLAPGSCSSSQQGRHLFLWYQPDKAGWNQGWVWLWKASRYDLFPLVRPHLLKAPQPLNWCSKLGNGCSEQEPGKAIVGSNHNDLFDYLPFCVELALGPCSLVTQECWHLLCWHVALLIRLCFCCCHKSHMTVNALGGGYTWHP